MTKKKKEMSEIPPWRNRVSLFQHIQEHLNKDGSMLFIGKTLPDEFLRTAAAERALDADGTDEDAEHDVNLDDREKVATRIADLLNTIARWGTLAPKMVLYRLLTDDRALACLGLGIARFAEKNAPFEPYLHAFARFLVRESPDRGPLKLGIALFGLIQDPLDLSVLVQIGKHEEFHAQAKAATLTIIAKADEGDRHCG